MKSILNLKQNLKMENNVTPKQKAIELVNEFSIIGLHSKMDGIE